MQVKFKTLSAGASGIIRPGDVVEVSDAEAKLLIDGGYAEAVEKPVKKPETEAERDTAPEPKQGRKK